ncbi:MAG: UDP-3-O-(3-hydroxymyristoyl)glucosamine N-acyltransferase [Gemmatimonadales bacterium]
MTASAVPLSAAAIAELVKGRLEGNEAAVISAVGPLDRAHGGALSFLTSAKYRSQFDTSAAGAVLVPRDFERGPAGPATLIFVADPARAMAQAVHALFPPTRPAPGVDPTARLGRGCRLGAGVSIGPGAVVGAGADVGDGVVLAAGVVLEDGVRVGAGSRLDPNVVCYRGTVLGQAVVIKAGTVVGGAGFGFVSDRNGHHAIPHVGGCVLDDDVQVGANCAIDRGSVGDTSIGAGSRLDNHVHVGHNARIGRRCLLMGGVVVAGSARIGDDVVLAGHVAVGGHFTVGNGARIGAKAGVTSEVPPGADWSGFPARPHREFLRAQAALYRLAPIAGELETLVRERGTDHGKADPQG